MNVDIIRKIKGFLQGETTNHLVKTYFVYGFIALGLIIIKVLITRLYGLEEMGVFTYFFSLVSLVFLFSSFGLPEALTQTIIKNPAQLKKTLQYTLFLLVPFTIIIIILTIGITSITKLNPNLPYFNTAVAIYIITYTIHYVTYCFLRGQKKFSTASLFSLAGRILFIGLIIILYLINAPFIYILFSFGFSSFVIGVLAWPQISKSLRQLRNKTVFVEFKSFFLLAFSLFLMQVSFYSLKFVDALAIKYLTDFTSLGIYSAYASIANGLRMVAYVFPVVVLPMAAVSTYKLQKSFWRILLLLLPLTILTFFVSYLFVPSLYGTERLFILPLLLVISSSLLVIYSYFNSVFVGENSLTEFYLKILGIDFILSLVGNTLLTIVFVAKWGIVGAPIALSITVVIKIVLNIYGIRKLRNHSSKDE